MAEVMIDGEPLLALRHERPGGRRDVERLAEHGEVCASTELARRLINLIVFVPGAHAEDVVDASAFLIRHERKRHTDEVRGDDFDGERTRERAVLNRSA